MARGSSASGASFSSHDSIELSSPPALPTAASSRCQRRDGDRGRRAGDHRPGRRRARACRPTRPGHDRTDGRLAPLAESRRPQPRRRALRGRCTRIPRRAPGRGLATSPFVALSWSWGRRQRRDRADGNGPFAIETKARTFHAHHLANTREMAAWLYRYRRRWCPTGALAVLCVVGARGVERFEDDVLIVSHDRLLPALRVRAEPHHARGFSPHRNHTADHCPRPNRRPVVCGRNGSRPSGPPSSNRRKRIVAEPMAGASRAETRVRSWRRFRPRDRKHGVAITPARRVA